MHNPERREGESMQDYRERREQAKRATRRILAGVYIKPRTKAKAPSSTDRERARVKAARPAAQQPKFPRERKHNQHEHHHRDGDGAYTLVGKGLTRRKWLAGVSAQRGY